MKRTLALLALAATLLAAAPAAQAGPFFLGPRLSIELDDTNVAVGVEGRLNLATIGRSVGLQLRPSFDYYFIDNLSLFDIALDFLFVFEVGSATVEPYAGIGLSIFIYNPDGPADGGTEAGLNLVGGAKFLPHGRVQPFVELRPTIGDFDPILLTFGVLFII